MKEEDRPVDNFQEGHWQGSWLPLCEVNLAPVSQDGVELQPIIDRNKIVEACRKYSYDATEDGSANVGG